VNKQDERS